MVFEERGELVADILKYLLISLCVAIIVWFGLPALGIAITFTQAAVFVIVIQSIVILVVSVAKLEDDEQERVHIIVMQTVNDDKEGE